MYKIKSTALGEDDTKLFNSLTKAKLLLVKRHLELIGPLFNYSSIQETFDGDVFFQITTRKRA